MTAVGSATDTQYVPAQIVVVEPSRSSNLLDIKKKHVKLTGIIIIVCGLLMMVANIIGLCIGNGMYMYASTGIWTGVLAIVAGSFGIAAGYTSSKCLVITYLVLYIVTSAFLSAPFLHSAFGIAVFRICWSVYDPEAKSGYHYDYRCYYIHNTGYVVFYVIMLLSSIAAFIATLLGEIVACRAVCCTKKAQTTGSSAAPLHFVTTSVGNQLGTTAFAPCATYTIQQPSSLPGERGHVQVIGSGAQQVQGVAYPRAYQSQQQPGTVVYPPQQSVVQQPTELPSAAAGGYQNPLYYPDPEKSGPPS